MDRCWNSFLDLFRRLASIGMNTRTVQVYAHVTYPQQALPHRSRIRLD
jgi:hypothetical protein